MAVKRARAGAAEGELERDPLRGSRDRRRPCGGRVKLARLDSSHAERGFGASGAGRERAPNDWDGKGLGQASLASPGARGAALRRRSRRVRAVARRRAREFAVMEPFHRAVAPLQRDGPTARAGGARRGDCGSARGKRTRGGATACVPARRVFRFGPSASDLQLWTFSSGHSAPGIQLQASSFGHSAPSRQLFAPVPSGSSARAWHAASRAPGSLAASARTWGGSGGTP